MKKHIVKAISCIAAVIITLNLFVTITHARTYNDTQGRWMETFVDKMTELDIMFSSSTTYFTPVIILHVKKPHDQFQCFLKKRRFWLHHIRLPMSAIQIHTQNT